jgi:hypothetical protein
VRLGGRLQTKLRKKVFQNSPFEELLMKRITASAIGVAVILLAVSLIQAQERREPARGRAGLPAGWSKLGLTDDQKQKVYSIQSEYQGKIEDLRRQVRQLQRQERGELEKVLTDTQKARLRELITEKAPGAAPSKDEGQQTPDKKP